RGHPIDPEKDERADYGEDDALDRESVQWGAGDHVPQESTDERTYDADDNRNDDAAGIVTRHDGLGDRSCDEAKNDPCENSHLPSSKVYTSADRMEHRCGAEVQPAYHSRVIDVASRLQPG